MSTFVIQFINKSKRNFQGKVRHVGSGEEASFGSTVELLNFFEEMTLGEEGGEIGDLEEVVQKAPQAKGG